MDALQAALPPTMPVSSGVSAMEAVPASLPQTLPTSGASADWGYSFTQLNDSSAPSGIDSSRIDFGSKGIFRLSVNLFAILKELCEFI